MEDLRFSQRWIWRVSSSDIWRRVVRWVPTDISEKHIASIFRAEEINSARNQQATKRCLPPAFTLVSCSACFSTLNMKAIYSSETSVDPQRTTRRHIPEDDTLQNYMVSMFTMLYHFKIVFHNFRRLKSEDWLKERDVGVGECWVRKDVERNGRYIILGTVDAKYLRAWATSNEKGKVRWRMNRAREEYKDGLGSFRMRCRWRSFLPSHGPHKTWC
jgi:hypothetical protein